MGEKLIYAATFQNFFDFSKIVKLHDLGKKWSLNQIELIFKR